jgi:hypothetical protein
MKRGLPAAALLAALALLLSTASAAPPVAVIPDPAGARLTVSGKLVAVFRASNGSLSPRERAEHAAARLRERLGQGLRPQAVEARERGDTWGVYAGDTLLMIATGEEAAARKETPETIARRWSGNLRTALAGHGGKAPAPIGAEAKRGKDAAPARKSEVPRERLAAAPEKKPEKPASLKVADPSLAVPVGETRTMSFGGTASGPARVRTDGKRFISVRVLPGKAAVEVRGLTPGRDVVRVTRGGKEAAFKVWVKKHAGRVAAIASARVTGVMAPGSLVGRIAAEQALEGVRTEPGATAQVTGLGEGSKALARGDSAQVSFPVSITGEGYFPVKTTVRVQVKNIALPEEETAALLYSNDPESVREPGTLFQGLVDEKGPVRLLYHHQNRTGRPFVFQVYLLNPGNAPVEVQVIEGDAGPFVDPVQVGHRAGQRYLAAATQDVGYIARIPGRGARLISSASVPDPETVSGIYGLRIVKGGPLVAQVDAGPALSRPEVYDGLLAVARNQPHTYPSPQQDESYHYTVGEKWAFAPMGRKAITATDPNRKLFGNYGVLYNITVDVDNPTNETQTIRVILSPEAGTARGVFVIEGKLVEAPQVAPPGEAELWTARLEAHGQRRLNIQGIPVGGSSYPVSIVVRS